VVGCVSLLIHRNLLGGCGDVFRFICYGWFMSMFEIFDFFVVLFSE